MLGAELSRVLPPAPLETALLTPYWQEFSSIQFLYPSVVTSPSMLPNFM
jgi:hypothetical protein